MNRCLFPILPCVLALLLVGCGGGGGTSTPQTQPPPPPPHAVLVERIDAGGSYSIFQVKEDGTGWARISPVGTDAHYLTSDAQRVVYLEPTSTRFISVKWDGTGETILATGLLDLQYRGRVGSRVIYSGRTDLLDPETYTLFSVNLDGSGKAELGPTGARKTFQALAGGKVFFQRAMGGSDVDLYVVEADGTSPHDLSAASIAVDRFGALDGNTVYYIQESTLGGRARGIWAHALDGSGPDTMILTGPQIYEVHGVLNGRVITSYQSLTGETWIGSVAADGLSWTDIYATTGISATFRGFAGNRVVYERPFNPTIPDTDVWSCLADGASQAIVVATSAYDTVTAIRGTRVYVQTQATPGAQADLRVAQSDGTGLHSLAATGVDETFLFEVGNQVVYLQDIGGAGDLALVNGDGTGAVSLTTSAESELLIQYLASRIYYSRGAVGGTTARVLVMDATPGAVPTPLSDGSAFDYVVAVY